MTDDLIRRAREAVLNPWAAVAANQVLAEIVAAVDAGTLIDTNRLVRLGRDHADEGHAAWVEVTYTTHPVAGEYFWTVVTNCVDVSRPTFAEALAAAEKAAPDA